MSDESLNAHLDWLDDCAKEQMSECEHVLGQGFNIAYMEEYVWCIKCRRKWSKAEITSMINEYDVLKKLHSLAIPVAQIIKPGRHRLAVVIDEETSDIEKDALIAFYEEFRFKKEEQACSQARNVNDG